MEVVVVGTSAVGMHPQRTACPMGRSGSLKTLWDGIKQLEHHLLQLQLPQPLQLQLPQQTLWPRVIKLDTGVGLTSARGMTLLL